MADASGLALTKQFYVQDIDAVLGGLRAGFIAGNLCSYIGSLYSDGTCTRPNALLLPSCNS